MCGQIWVSAKLPALSQMMLNLRTKPSFLSNAIVSTFLTNMKKVQMFAVKLNVFIENAQSDVPG